ARRASPGWHRCHPRRPPRPPLLPYTTLFRSQAYLWLSGVATLVAAPLTLVALTALSPALYWSAIVAAELCLFASTGPINLTIVRSEEHTSELQSHLNLVCRLMLEENNTATTR